MAPGGIRDPSIGKPGIDGAFADVQLIRQPGSVSLDGLEPLSDDLSSFFLYHYCDIVALFP